MRALLEPKNVSGRSTQQIVKEAEQTWLKPYLIEYNDGQTKELKLKTEEHNTECRCAGCFQRELDRIVSLGEAYNHDSQIDTLGDASSD